MRVLVSLLAILVSIVALGLWSNYSLELSADDLSEQIDQVMVVIEHEQWEKAARQTADIEKCWAQSARWWPFFLDHQEMDNIEFSLARVKEYVKNRDAALSLGQLSEVRLMLKHIPEKEALSIRNIL